MVPHRQRLELAVDVLRGCANHCGGCMVNRDTTGVLDDIPEILALAHELVSFGYSPFDFTIGATDVLTATNTNEVLTDPNIKGLIALFDSLTLNAAFLDKRKQSYEYLGALVDDCAADKPVRFLIPATPGIFKNPKFGRGISERLGWVKAHIHKARLFEAGFVVNCTRETLADGAIEHLRLGFDLKFPVKKDDILNIPYGRANRTDIQVAESVKFASHEISRFYSSFECEEERTKNPDLCNYTGTMLNLTYSEGELYWVPFLKDECAFLHDNFKIPRPWTAQSVLEARSSSMVRSLDYLQNDGCASCANLSNCAEKGITTIMQTLSLKDCLVGL